MLGKRKRETIPVSRPGLTPDIAQPKRDLILNYTDVFRQHFEAKFAGLPPLAQEHVEEAEEDDELLGSVQDEETDWEGLSDTDDPPPVVEVVDHLSNPPVQDDELGRARKKAFMSSRVPRDQIRQSSSAQKKPIEAEDPAEMVNLQHDLDLQRLLQESHLLEKSRTSSTPGKERQRALDMRLQSLGAKTAMFDQQNMPLSHRRGIIDKASWREKTRRQQAKDNGIILEKPSRKSSSTSRRDRGVGGPGIGRFSGGTLKLSRSDVAGIQGPASKRGIGGKNRWR